MTALFSLLQQLVALIMAIKTQSEKRRKRVVINEDTNKENEE